MWNGGERGIKVLHDIDHRGKGCSGCTVTLAASGVRHVGLNCPSGRQCNHALHISAAACARGKGWESLFFLNLKVGW